MQLTTLDPEDDGETAPIDDAQSDRDQTASDR